MARRVTPCIATALLVLALGESSHAADAARSAGVGVGIGQRMQTLCGAPAVAVAQLRVDGDTPRWLDMQEVLVGVSSAMPPGSSARGSDDPLLSRVDQASFRKGLLMSFGALFVVDLTATGTALEANIRGWCADGGTGRAVETVRLAVEEAPSRRSVASEEADQPPARPAPPDAPGDDSPPEEEAESGPSLALRGGFWASKGPTFGTLGITYHAPRALWTRAVVATRLGPPAGGDVAALQELALDTAPDSAAVTTPPKWSEQRLEAQLMWELPLHDVPLAARIGLAAMAENRAGFVSAAEAYGVTPDMAGWLATGPGVELGYPLQVADTTLVPTLTAAHLLPVWVRSPRSSQELAELRVAYPDTRFPTGFVGRRTLAGGYVTAARGPLTARLECLMVGQATSPFWQQLSEEFGLSENTTAWTPRLGLTLGVQLGVGGGTRGGAAGSGPVDLDGFRFAETGLSSVDDVFSKAQDILDRISAAREALADFEQAVVTASGLASDASLDSVLELVKAEAQGSVQVEIRGLTPMVTIAPGASGPASDAVRALNDGFGDLAAAIKDLGGIPDDVKQLVEAASALPGKLPDEAKSAGLSPLQIPGALKAVADNTRALSSIPAYAAETVGQLTRTLNVAASLGAGP